MLQLLFFTSAFWMILSCHPPLDKEHTHDLLEVIALPKELNECSGMIQLDKNSFVALNDGGNKPILYAFDLTPDHETRKIKIDSVENNDWEDLTKDEDYIYIGDTGNNGGTRQNLMIYKVRKSDMMRQDEVVPEKIKFRYEGQTKFNDSNRHNFDCEAIVSVGDSLFLFTKNRGDLMTDVYGIPKIPGSYLARKLKSFDAQGLITGADYRSDHSKSELVLIGYNEKGHQYHPFLIHFTNFSGTDFFGGLSERITIDQQLQSESVFFNGDHKVYISNEENKNEKGYVYEVSL
ncbi:MAG: hypothetical protein IPP15_02885 [Saprospiraceae bacterium]|uniref:Uncharacterized protein n=1 Tax=Candidatus Opimibacter skivensis TaxID=2982028 RepID=A0A9D7SQR6_9BACT|nr:hypothetical protein [Candidatus Opimibacter skivensis]